MRFSVALLVLVSLAPSAFAGTPPSDRKKHPDVREAVEVSQREYTISDARTHLFVETASLATCVGVTLYDRQTTTGLLAHVDAPTRLGPSFERVFQEFTKRGIPLSRLEAHVIGGQTHPSHPEQDRYDHLASDLLATLHEAGIQVVETDLGGENAVRAIMLELDTGEVFDFDDVAISPSSSPELEQAKRDRLWDSPKHEHFCDGLLYRHEQSLPSVGVPTEQPADRACY
jgi:chemotaxis receptor (MCP) glutamine deamidase CheD